MVDFALYLHPEVVQTTKPFAEIQFAGHSIPYFKQVYEGIVAEIGTQYARLPLRLADYALYETVHTGDYLDKLGRMARDEKLTDYPKLSAECRGFEYALPAYQYSLGGLVEAIDQMKTGNLQRAFCFSLGGHHAYPDSGHGYCLLNPLAAAIRYAQSQGFAKVLIVDWDIHHGDGTQAIFAHDASVYHISIHSGLDLYMALAAGMRLGTTTAAEAVGQCNIPLLSAAFPSDILEQLNLEGKFYRAGESLPALRSALDHLPWVPDLIAIFGGVDSHKDDCGGGITDWDNQDFATLTRWMKDLAQKAHCPLLSVSGGGYKLPVTIPALVSHIQTLAE